MIPNFEDIGAPWKVLPNGIHEATLDEIEQRFAINAQRRHLMKGLRKACRSLKSAGCKTVYLDGSFITEKKYPNDFDACWDPINVDDNKLDRVFLDFSNGRKNQKNKFYGELFPSSGLATKEMVYIDFFQQDKDTNSKKGIIRINI